MVDYQSIIGLEVHIELATKSKMFCGCPADHFGKKPNTQTCPVCLGLPGSLPVPNKKTVEWTVLLGLALHCTINAESKFDRKHYFYPDLPKGYQISQYDQPIAVNGELVISSEPSESRNLPAVHHAEQFERSLDFALDDKGNVIRIRRVHLEEDTGKLMHETVNGERVTLVDFNRSGVPLVEIVTEPDFRSVDEVDVFLKKLQQIIRYLGISGADMEKGSMRLEPSISMRCLSLRASAKQSREIATPSVRSRDDKNEDIPNYRVELKNINSFRFARKALEYEIARQINLFERGEKPTQQTRGWNEAKGATVSQREKEEAHDYRYFPEPDIPPMCLAQAQISKLKAQIPELPDTKKERFMKNYGLSEYDAGLVTETREKAEYFEEAMRVAISHQPSAISQARVTAKTIANWLINRNIHIDEVLPAQLVERIRKASQVASVPEEELENIVKQVLDQNQKAVEDYKKGKEQAFMFLFGAILRQSGGKGDKQKIQELLRRKLNIK